MCRMSSHEHDHDHGHSHNHAPQSLSALVGVLTLTSVVFLAELIAGIVSGSLALLADAAHMLSDSAGLVVALAACWWVGARHRHAQPLGIAGQKCWLRR